MFGIYIMLNVAHALHVNIFIPLISFLTDMLYHELTNNIMT